MSRTNWFVLVKVIGDKNYFMNKEGLASEVNEALVSPMSDSLIDDARDFGYFPVPAFFFGFDMGD